MSLSKDKNLNARIFIVDDLAGNVELLEIRDRHADGDQQAAE